MQKIKEMEDIVILRPDKRNAVPISDRAAYNTALQRIVCDKKLFSNLNSGPYDEESRSLTYITRYGGVGFLLLRNIISYI